MNKRKMNQRLRRRTDLDKGLLDRGWHSKAYHRHFEGYTELEETDEKGNLCWTRAEPATVNICRDSIIIRQST